jgi:hypothetical protein
MSNTVFELFAMCDHCREQNDLYNDCLTDPSKLAEDCDPVEQ